MFSESVVQGLEIQDDDAEESTLYDSQSLSADPGKDKADQQVEVHILQSGQIEFSTAASVAQYSASCCDAMPSTASSSGVQSSHGNCSFRLRDRSAEDRHGSDQAQLTSSIESTRSQPIESRPDARFSLLTSPGVAEGQRTRASGDAQCSMLASTVTRAPRTKQPTKSTRHTESMNVSVQTSSRPTAQTPPIQTSPHPPVQTSPHPIRNHSLLSSQCPDAGTDQCALPTTSMPHPSHNDSDKMQKSVRRSGRKKSNSTDKITSPKRGAYNLRHKLNPSTDITPPPAKKSKLVGDTASSESGYDSGRSTDPLEWGVDDVTRFISGVPRCNYTDVFREHVSKPPEIHYDCMYRSNVCALSVPIGHRGAASTWIHNLAGSLLNPHVQPPIGIHV